MYISTATITDQIRNANSAGKLVGGISAAIPITIATTPSQLGSGAPRRIAMPLHTPKMKAPTSVGRNSSVEMKLSVLTVSGVRSVEVVRDPVFDPSAGQRAGGHQDGARKHERGEPLRRGAQVGAQRAREQHEHEEPEPEQDAGGLDFRAVGGVVEHDPRRTDLRFRRFAVAREHRRHDEQPEQDAGERRQTTPAI